MNQFLYDELASGPGLQTIRLVEVQPGKTEDALRCSIHKTSLTDDPDYEAISYCWGPDHAVDKVICDDETYLPLNRSLSSALRHFRHDQEPRLLWADAICINQSDADEKSRQVNMMREVYRQARRVLIWLGEEGEGDTLEPLIKLAQKLATVDVSRLPKDRVGRQKSLGFEDAHILSLSSLLERPWFRRVWVVQEVAVASEAILYCGHKSLTWEGLCSILALESGINMIGVNNQMVMDIVEGIEFEKKAASQSAATTLFQVLLRHRTSLATDPRDKVYALLGLCTDDILQANYRLPTQEVHRLLTQTCLRQHCSLDIITAPSNPISLPPNTAPSWVPDWSATDVAFPLALRTQLIPDMDYQATGQSKWIPKFSEEEKMLGVEAQFIDEVITLGLVRRPYRPDKPDMKALFKQLRAEFIVSNCWQKICLGDATGWKDLYLTGETLFDVSWQILLAGCPPSEYEACRKQAKRVWKVFRKYILANRLHLLPLWVFGLMDDIAKLTGKTIFLRRILAEAVANDFQFRVRRSISHRRIMRTKNGYLGLAPAFTQIGDRVALLKGVKTPVIIRPKGEEWEFVGDCYVHGIMNGEAFHPDQCGEIWLA